MLAFEFLRIFLYHYLFYPLNFDFFCPVEGKKNKTFILSMLWILVIPTKSH